MSLDWHTTLGRLTFRSTRIVSIVGIDGSGKTTHARKLVSELKASGISSNYVWLRSVHFFSLPFMALCRILGLTRKDTTPAGATRINHQYYKNSAISRVWPWIQLFDLIIFFKISIMVYCRRKSVVVTDRFVHDILIDVMADVHDQELPQKIVGKLILELVPRATLVILFDTRETTAFRRKRDVPSLRYLSTRRDLYHLLAGRLGIPIVSTSQRFVSAHKRLLELITTDRSRVAHHVE